MNGYPHYGEAEEDGKQGRDRVATVSVECPWEANRFLSIRWTFREEVDALFSPRMGSLKGTGSREDHLVFDPRMACRKRN